MNPSVTPSPSPSPTASGAPGISVNGVQMGAVPSPSLPEVPMAAEPEKKPFPVWAIVLIVLVVLLLIAGGVFAYGKFKAPVKNVGH